MAADRPRLAVDHPTVVPTNSDVDGEGDVDIEFDLDAVPLVHPERHR